MITKTAMITICGRPNVGKSTLTNALVGEKIAIVSNKPQTTRNRISAVVNRGDTQLILMDTPGFHKPRNRLGDYMVQVVRESVADVDGVMLVVEPIASIGEQEHALIERIRTSNAPAVLVINKIDTVEKPELLAVIAAYSEALPWRAIVPVSAQNGDGLDDLFSELRSWDYASSRNPAYRKLRARLEKLQHTLHQGSRLERIRRAGAADLCYLAVPTGLIAPDEIEAGWGIVYLNADRSFTLVREAEPQTGVEPCNRQFLAQNIAVAATTAVLFMAGVDRRGKSVRFRRFPRKRQVQ